MISTHVRPLRLFGLTVIIAALAACGGAAAPRPEAAPEAAVGQRPFAWPPGQQVPSARGEAGSVGAPVQPAAVPAAAWSEVTALPPGVDRDRAAIRALAGDFRVTFDFQEVVSLRPGQDLAAPYHSWATERVFIVADTPNRISLQHQLVVRTADKPTEAMVVKHWREDWTWQDTAILAFQGLGKWRVDARQPADVEGAWSQAVWGVDDEPRYESNGRWRHDGQTSQWISERQWRPLPRREYTKRKDYQALDGIHRIVITPDGWVQWQDNGKLPLSAPGTPVAEGPLAIEIGCARYERISGFDWTPGVTAWAAESAHAAAIRTAWDERIAAAAPGTLIDRDALSAEIDAAVDGAKPGSAATGKPAP